MTHPQLLAAMQDPAFYPGRPKTVELVQTHISFIFIAGDEVYKVKKAVDFGFLDFTSLEKRRHYCAEELRLNRRLAPQAYLDVVEISESAGGTLVLGLGGRIVDYAVRMRRLPQERMLKKLIAADDFDPAIMDKIAVKLADFHRQAATGDAIDRLGGLSTIRRNHEENFEQTGKYVGITIPEAQYRFVRNYVHEFLEGNEALLERRVAEGRIRDCHGDLHLEHIVVDGNEITIFDCIEFNERFRYGDVAAEVAFLAMDLDFNGYSPHADRFVGAYTQYAGDAGIPVLLHFYQCYYAYVRGKVVSFRLDDPAIGPEEREAAKDMARRYFDLAYTYAARLERPTLILLAGLTGTGKSVLAREIAPRLGAVIIQTDALRKELQGIAPEARHYEAFGEGIYGPDASRRTYGEAHLRASSHLRSGRSVIIDASYKRRAEREAAVRMAEEAGADYWVVDCVCPEEIARKRLEARMSTPGEASDGRWEIYLAQREDFDPILEIPAAKRLTLDTSASPDRCAQEVIEATRYRSPGIPL
jgi:uncharacterized protein